MTTIQVQTQLSLTTLLNSLKQLTPNELNEVSQQTALAALMDDLELKPLS